MRTTRFYRELTRLAYKEYRGIDEHINAELIQKLRLCFPWEIMEYEYIPIDTDKFFAARRKPELRLMINHDVYMVDVWLAPSIIRGFLCTSDILRDTGGQPTSGPYRFVIEEIDNALNAKIDAHKDWAGEDTYSIHEEVE